MLANFTSRKLWDKVSVIETVCYLVVLLFLSFLKHFSLVIARLAIQVSPTSKPLFLYFAFEIALIFCLLSSWFINVKNVMKMELKFLPMLLAVCNQQGLMYQIQFTYMNIKTMLKYKSCERDKYRDLLSNNLSSRCIDTFDLCQNVFQWSNGLN